MDFGYSSTVAKESTDCSSSSPSSTRIWLTAATSHCSATNSCSRDNLEEIFIKIHTVHCTIVPTSTKQKNVDHISLQLIPVASKGWFSIYFQGVQAGIIFFFVLDTVWQIAISMFINFFKLKTKELFVKMKKLDLLKILPVICV